MRRQQWTGSNGNLWSQPYVPPRRDKDYIYINKSLRTATLLTCIGSDARDVYEGLEFDSEDDKKDIDIVLQKLQRYCIGETNEIHERYRFNKRDQEPNESLDAYVTALRSLAKTWNFGVLENSLIRDRIVIGVRDNQTRKKLLQVSKLTLKECIDICRSYETSNQQFKEINQKSAPLVSPMKRNLEKFAASSAPKRMYGTNLNVLHGERSSLIVEFKTTLRWPAKPNRLHPVRPHPLNLPHRDASASQYMQWRILTLTNMSLVLMSRSKSVLWKILIVKTKCLR